MTLYLKYRPKNLDELDLLDVSESLKKVILSESVPHAFLFAGPKGTGKTSAARILAKIINCESTSLKLRGPGHLKPCEECNQCISITKGNNLDVIEMDAASNRGIDDIRSLRDAIKLAPTYSKKKIYIIDEAHMLTTEASNALLKTLEEPPEHVIFILATTNPEKLIDTIRSRTTLIPFRKATTGEIIKSLKRVIQSEKIKITDELLTTIAVAANGAFRDAIKILEQFALEGEAYLSSFQKSELNTFMDSLAKRDESAAISEIEKNISLGVSADAFLINVLETFHRGLLREVGIEEVGCATAARLPGLSKNDLIILTDLFIDSAKNLGDSPIAQLPIEIAVVKWCSTRMMNDELRIMNENPERNSEDDPVPDVKKVESAPAEKKNNESRIKNDVKGGNNDGTAGTVTDVIDIRNSSFAREAMQSIQYSSINDDIWKNILLAVRPINASIEGLLRASRPISYDGKILTLGVFYKFHKERLEDAHHRRVVEDTIAKILNAPTKVICTLVDPPPKKIIEEAVREPVLTEAHDADIIKIAEDIFSN